jgi:hypothetical protein
MNKKALGLLSLVFLMGASIAHADCWTSSNGLLFSGFTPQDAIAACDYSGGIYIQCQEDVQCNAPMPVQYPYPVYPGYPYPVYPGYPVGPGYGPGFGPHPGGPGGFGPRPGGPGGFGPRPGMPGPVRGGGRGPRLDVPTDDSNS